MGIQSSRHQAVLEELTEWWEDLRDRGIGSRVVLVSVPHRWGRSSLLTDFRGVVDDLDGPLTFRISCTPRAGRAVQAQELREALTTTDLRARAARLFGLDTTAGEVQLGLGIGGLLASGLAAAVPLLLTSLAVTATGNAWDASPSGQQGTVARAARAVAAVSVSAPVLVTIDDAELLDLGLAVTMIENLASRYDGQVLVVVTVTPESELEATLFSPGRYELLGRVHKADADPDMSYAARAAIAEDVCLDVPDVAIERIARRTQNFAEVFAVAGADKLADLAQMTGVALLAAVEKVINATLERAKVSAEATVLAWAGGVLHIRQADKGLEALGADRKQADPWVIRAGRLARVTDPASPRLTEQVEALAGATRRQLAALMLDEAINIAKDPDATLVERIIAQQAAHHVRADLQQHSRLTTVQSLLIRDLEDLGDPTGAYEVAIEAVAIPAKDPGKDRRELLEAVIRLAQTQPPQSDDPQIGEALALAVSGGAMLGLEARIWAAVDLLNRPSRREAALKLIDQVTTELANYPSGETTGNQWRLLLAFHVGRSGYPAISQRLLAPMINTATTKQQEAAQAILYAIGGSRVDTRLQIIFLETELAATPLGADDDLLHLRSTLAADYYTLGNYRSALQHAGDELTLRGRLQGPDHPNTLTTRGNVAGCTGESGNGTEALRLYQELLPDQIRMLKADHPGVLATRGHVATWTGQCGNRKEALRLLQELLPDQIRMLGAGHPDTLSTRGHVAFWTGQYGNHAEALHLSQELLPDRVRVLGADHPGTLSTRGHVAFWTGQCGNRAEALRLYQELLPDQERVLGADHPGTLTIRGHVAFWTGQCGNRTEALRLYQELLPDQERVLGADHPDTLNTCGHVGLWTGRCGNHAEALRLSQELLPDRVRVLGPDHPDTLTTRGNVAGWTGDRGNSMEALRLFRELLPDQERVLGPDHPDTLTTRGHVALWTGQCGNSAEALRLYQELLPRQVRVLGSDHPDTLSIRGHVGLWTGKCGNGTEALRLYRELLSDQMRVSGPDHPDTLLVHEHVALWTGQCGNRTEALRLSQELLPEQIRVFGPDHPHTLTIRGNVAFWIGQCGNSMEALRLSQELLPDRVRVLGPDHPDTLSNRNNVAFWTGRSGNSAEALRLSEELLPGCVRVLGADHPGTLTNRSNVAFWTGRSGNSAEALRLSQELLTDQVRVLGSDHPDTLTTRGRIALWTGEGGNNAKALRQYQELLTDQVRVLGSDHPDTFTTRLAVAHLVGES
jgi:hypothetical protein